MALDSAINATHNSFVKDGQLIEYYRAFTEEQVQAIIEALEKAVDSFGGVLHYQGLNQDAPLRFKGADLADHLEDLAQQENVSQFVDFLVDRIRALLSDSDMRAIIDDADAVTLHSWLAGYLGSERDSTECVSVIDLSLVPTEVVHVVTAVVARIVFEAIQRYAKVNGSTLPTVLVMEEAHMFIKRYRDDAESTDAAAVCCQVFERIAREGRKFGLGLVLSSQRPSELSPTVLSQCNTFLLHQISNDRDQDMVHRLVPDNLRGLLRELPSLPSQNAILLGWASELPILVKMNDLPESQQPRSDNPDFWRVWTGEEQRPIDWQRVADDWAGTVQSPIATEAEATDISTGMPASAESSTIDNTNETDNDVPF